MAVAALSHKRLQFADMSTPAHLKLELFQDLDLSQRSSDLPEVYLYTGNHPQRPSTTPPESRTFVVLIDFTDDGKAADVERGKRLDIPKGREADMTNVYGMWLCSLSSCYSHRTRFQAWFA